MDTCSAEFEVLDRTVRASLGARPFTITKMRDRYGHIAGVEFSDEPSVIMTVSASNPERFLVAISAIEAESRRDQMFFMRAGSPSGKAAMRRYNSVRSMSVFGGVDGVTS